MFIFLLVVVLIIAVVVGIAKGVAGGVKQQSDLKKIGENYENLSASGLVTHSAGLPNVPENLNINGYITDEDLIFVKDSSEFVIKLSNISAVDIVAGKNINAGGAAVGYLVFGVAGALIGATTEYLVITYKSNGENKSILLKNMPTSQFYKELKKLAPKIDPSAERERIEL